MEFTLYSIPSFRRYYPYICLFIAQLMVAINVVGSKVISSHITLLPALFLRFSIAFVVSLLLCLGVRGKSELRQAILTMPLKSWVYLCLQGLCAGALFNVFIFWGLQTVPASLAGMILSLLPAVIAVVAIVFLKEHLTLGKILCISLAILGVIILHYAPTTALTSPFGLGLIFLSLIPEAAYYLLIKAYQPKVNIYIKAVILNLTNIIVLFPFMAFYGFSHFNRLDLLSFEVLLITGCSATLFFIFWYLGAKNMMASRAGIFTAINPLLTAILSMVFLNEQIGPVQAIGMLVIIASVWVSTIKASA